jgi:hypothetical protein
MKRNCSSIEEEKNCISLEKVKNFTSERIHLPETMYNKE